MFFISRMTYNITCDNNVYLFTSPTYAGPPSSPRLAINSPPIISGTEIRACWLPSLERGGRDDFHYNIYALAVGSDQFRKVNDLEILPNVADQDMEDRSEPVCYNLILTEGQSSYTIVVVASNGAVNDAEIFTDISAVQDRFIAFYVATGGFDIPVICPEPLEIIIDPPVSTLDRPG